MGFSVTASTVEVCRQCWLSLSLLLVVGGVGGCMGSGARQQGCAWVGMHKVCWLACGDSVGDIVLHTRHALEGSLCTGVHV